MNLLYTDSAAVAAAPAAKAMAKAARVSRAELLLFIVKKFLVEWIETTL
jgi:hypothetical protein